MSGLKKNSFTLIELLAILMILAIISLIATPIVFNVIEKAKDSADWSSAFGLVEAGRIYCAEAKIDEIKQEKINNYVEIYKDINVRGQKPDNGKLYVNKNCQVAVATIIRYKCYKKEFYGQLEVVRQDDCDFNYIGDDDTKPSVIFEPLDENVKEGNWATHDFFVKVQVLDEQSGPKDFIWCSTIEGNCIPISLYPYPTGNVLISNESDKNKICVQARDNYENMSEIICSDTYKLDKTAPSIQGVKNIKVNLNEAVDLEQGVVLEDFGSGIDGTYSYMPKKIDTSKIGNTVVTYTAKDKAGNVSIIEKNIEVLGDAPKIEFAVQGNPFNSNNWAKKDFYVKANVSDNSTKGIKAVKWCSSVEDTCLPVAQGKEENVILISKESNNNHICVEAIDNNDKVTTLCSESYKLDKMIPAIKGLNNIIVNLKENINLDSEITVSDSLSGINGNYSYTPTSINSNEIGITTVTYRVSDMAGNETVQIRTVEVLGDAPKIEFAVQGKPFNSNNWAKKDFYVKANVSDNSTKGIKIVKWCSSVEDTCLPVAQGKEENIILISKESNNNHICIEAIDNNDKVTTLCSESYKLDKTNPSLDGVSDKLIQRFDTIDLKEGIIYQDILSGIEKDIVITPSIIDTSKAGTTLVTYQVIDKAGNEVSLIRKIIVDSKAPIITYQVQGNPINENGWANSDFYVKGNIQDQSGLGIKSVKWCSSTSGTCVPLAELTGTELNSLISEESANNRICIQAIDNNNKTTEVVCSDTYKLDKTAPTAGNFIISGDKGNNNWYTSNVTIGYTNGSDSLSGHDQTWTSASSINSNTSGTQVVLFTKDKAGNVSTKNITIKLDKSVPSVPNVTMKKNNASGATYTSNEWTNQNVYISLNANSSISGVDHYEYSNNGSSWYSMSGSSMTINTEGATNLYFRSVSNSGIKSNATNLHVIKIDKTAPSAPSVTMKKGGSNGASYTSNTWVGQSVYISLSYSKTDASGINHYEYSNNGSNWYSMSGSSMTIKTEGSTTIYFRAVDNAGNNGSSTSSSIIKIDSNSPSAPSVTMKKGSSSGNTYTSDTWTNENVYISLSYNKTDASGISRYEYSNNGSTWYSISGSSTTINTEGTTKIYFRAIDGAGNKGSSTSVYIIKIDKTKPVVPTLKMNQGSSSGLTYTSNTWTNKIVYISLSYSKTDASGIDHYEYSTNGNSWSKMTYNPMTVTKEGTTEYYFRVVDSAGNASPATSKQIIKYDKTAPSGPTVTIRKGSDSGAIYSTGTWTPLDLYIKGSYSKSDLSGIAGYQFSTDNRNWTAVSTSSARINVAGQFTVYMRAVDNAGNVGSVTTVYNVYKSNYLVDSGSGNGHFVYYKNVYWRIIGRSGKGSSGTVTLLSASCVGPTFSVSRGNTSAINNIKNGIQNTAKSYYDRNYINSYRPVSTSDMSQTRNATANCGYWAYDGVSATANYVAPNSYQYTSLNSAYISGGLTREYRGSARVILTTKSGIYVTNNKNGAGESQAWTIGY